MKQSIMSPSESDDKMPTIKSSRESLQRKEITAKRGKQPTLAEQMEVVDEWWKELDPQKRLEVPLSSVGELFVRKGIA